LIKILKNKNGGSSGRKRKNHAVNSDPKSTEIGGLTEKRQKRNKEVADEDISANDELTEEDEEEIRIVICITLKDWRPKSISMILNLEL
jgi:hypothetical protein